MTTPTVSNSCFLPDIQVPTLPARRPLPGLRLHQLSRRPQKVGAALRKDFNTDSCLAYIMIDSSTPPQTRTPSPQTNASR